MVSLLTSCRTLKLDNKTKEKEYCLEFAKTILIPLFGEVIFEMGYADYIKGVQGATLEHLGLGSESTWHGVTEMRIRGCDFVTTNLGDTAMTFIKENDRRMNILDLASIL